MLRTVFEGRRRLTGGAIMVDEIKSENEEKGRNDVIETRVLDYIGLRLNFFLRG